MTLEAELPAFEAVSGFAVIPVIDLKDGFVVHARAGKRRDYRPIATPFGPAQDPVAIARALLAVTGSTTLYIADLDAIMGRGNNFDLCRELADAFPSVTLWIDAGISDVTDCVFWLPLDATLVIGSESVTSLRTWENIRASFGQHVVLSLDFDEYGLRGPKDVLTDPALWPDRLILMSLARVGMEEGPDLDRLERMLGLAGHRAVFTAGGVRHAGDLERTARAGARGALIATALHSRAVTKDEIAALRK
jgi:phosphoribosylformimino-5-aminoimidazole carboxamide ribotide isomerase